jgi:hypothetical protein
MAEIRITDVDAGKELVRGDGKLVTLALIDAGQAEPWSLFALVDGRGFGLFLSDLVGLIPVTNEIWGRPLLSFAVPFVDGLVARSVPAGSAWRIAVLP